MAWVDVRSVRPPGASILLYWPKSLLLICSRKLILDPSIGILDLVDVLWGKHHGIFMRLFDLVNIVAVFLPHHIAERIPLVLPRSLRHQLVSIKLLSGVVE